MDFHPFMADADTIFERFDEDPVFKEWGRTEILQRYQRNTLFRDSHVSSLLRAASSNGTQSYFKRDKSVQGHAALNLESISNRVLPMKSTVIISLTDVETTQNP
jgi:hypothetical protein